MISLGLIKNYLTTALVALQMHSLLSFHFPICITIMLGRLLERGQTTHHVHCTILILYFYYNLQLQLQLQSYMENDNQQQNTQPEPQSKHQFIQYGYRWVVVGLVAYMMIVNGILNGNVNPIAHKIQTVYELSTVQVSAPIFISFLVYSIVNFPANYIIDRRGVRFSFIIGSVMYLLSSFMAALINKSFALMIISAIFTGIGQPFILNCTSKVATQWFLSKNRTLATAIMTAFVILGSAIGFIMPTLFVKEDSEGDGAKSDIFKLYAVEFIVSSVGFGLVMVLMKSSPPTLPSIGAEQQKTSLIQSIKVLRSNRSLVIFASSFVLMYGTFLAFGSSANLLFKPYGFTDIEISLLAISLLVFGVIGSITFSIYIKKTNNYKRVIRIIPVLSFVFMSFTILFLNVAPLIPIMFICVACLGFGFTPILPISYDLGCEMAFPLGEAQVIGILNGGSMLYTFIISLIVDLAVGLNTKHDSLVVMIVYSCIILVGCIGFFFVKVVLVRKIKEGEKMAEQTADEEVGQRQMQMGNIGERITQKISQIGRRFEQEPEQKNQKIALLNKAGDNGIDGLQGLHI